MYAPVQNVLVQEISDSSSDEELEMRQPQAQHESCITQDEGQGAGQHLAQLLAQPREREEAPRRMPWLRPSTTFVPGRGCRNLDGKLLDEDYEFGDQLGAGASSTVYKATYKRTGEPRALKVLQREVVDDMCIGASVDAEKAFRKELSVLQAVDHPNIVRLYDAFENNGCLVFAVEYCTGGNFLEYLENTECFYEDTAALAMQQICSATAHLHGFGIVHRDLKPQNILVAAVDENACQGHGCPVLKLADFGVASAVKDKNAGKAPMRQCRAYVYAKTDYVASGWVVQSTIGTSGYAAPEVLDGDTCDMRGDMWSLGMIAFVIISGENPNSVRSATLLGSLPELPEAVSETAADFVAWCLAVDPSQRCTASEALAHDWLTGSKPQEDPDRLSETLRRLRQFGQLTRLQRAFMPIVAYTMPSEQISELSASFQLLDTDQDGMLSLREIREAIERVDPTYKCDKKVFEALDTNQSQEVSYNEFVAACIGRQRYTQREVLWRTFCTIDHDGAGFISYEKLRRALQGTALHNGFGDSRKLIFAELNLEYKGKLDFSQFCKLMESGGRQDSGDEYQEQSPATSPSTREVKRRRVGGVGESSSSRPQSQGRPLKGFFYATPAPKP